MKTLAEIQNLAANMAEMHFYADYENKMAWEPYENHSGDWIEAEMDNMAEMLVRCMLWAQRDTLAG